MEGGAKIYQLAEEKLQSSGLITRLSNQDQPHDGLRGKAVYIQTYIPLEPKEFVWDRCVTLLVAGILSLTSVYLVVEFFRRPSSSVTCYVPKNFTIAQFTYINSYCSSFLSSVQYYPIFVTLQGLFIAAPHQLWSWTFSGYTKYFIDLAKTLDRLQSVRTARHRDANMAIVTKLEKEFSKAKVIFSGYVVKLFVQLALTAMALVVIFAAFNDFAIIFQCLQASGALYRNGNLALLHTGPVSFVCLYTPVQLMSILRYMDIALLCMVAVALLFGIGWCFCRHPDQLGARQLAHFTFHLCLPASQVKFLFDGLLSSSRIRDDLDFLLMQLYQADAGYGQVFKELQVEKVFQHVSAKDHKLLQAFNDRRKGLFSLSLSIVFIVYIISDLEYEMRSSKGDATCLQPENDSVVTKCDKGLAPDQGRDPMLCDLFEQAGFDEKPIAVHDFKPCTLSSIQVNNHNNKRAQSYLVSKSFLKEHFVANYSSLSAVLHILGLALKYVLELLDLADRWHGFLKL